MGLVLRGESLQDDPVSFAVQRNVFSRSAMSRRSLAGTCAYLLTIAAFYQPMTSIKGTERAAPLARDPVPGSATWRAK
jgi:hypothetical protein